MKTTSKHRGKPQPAPKVKPTKPTVVSGPKPLRKTTKKVIQHIAVAGNIGAGKTTLAGKLAKHYDWATHYEDVDNNPYLYDFYEDMPRWSFNLQVYFLNSRFSKIINIRKGAETVIQDRTIYEDAYIFAPNLHAMGLLSSRDFENYKNLFTTVNSLIQPPDLLIYLRGSIPTLVNQIQRRGREYEDNLRLDYIKRLNERYEAWIGEYTEGPLLIIDIDKVNFADHADHLGEVVNKVDAELNGLF